MPFGRPNTADNQSVASSSPTSSTGTKRRFPLLHRKKNRQSDSARPSTALPFSLSPSSPSSKSPKVKKPNLRVHVQIKFEAPLSQEHVRDYEASPQLVASDRLCQALLFRLQHCSAELVTRHDCSALDPLRKPHRDVKPLRYRITYRVERDGLTLVEKSLRSFQEYPPTADDAREVLTATDRIVGLFLVRHDPGFRWPELPDAEPTGEDTETVRPYTGRPQPTCCIPRSRFIHQNQTFELVPGYTIELFLRSRCATRYPENRNASIKIDSRQPSPLTLLFGEELITRASNLIIDPIDSWKRKFDKRHRNCNGFEGSGGCTHVEDGAVDVMVKVRNNLGPDYNYFSHRIQTSKVLFNDPNGRDFDEFANTVKAKLEKARDMSDKSLRSLDDLTVRIRELRGKNWSVHEPLTIRLDSTVTYCRQTVDAIMERLQSGISNVLESHEDALATLTVHKRGHLIFDGFLDGAGSDDSVPPEKYSSPDLERKTLESKLKDRIRADITMLCKDTCALDSSDYLPNLKIRASGASAGPRDNTRPENFTRPSSGSIAESLGSARSEHSLAMKTPQQSLREPSLPPSTPASLPPSELRRVPSGVEAAKKHGYMSDFIANEDEHNSEPPSTPSLVDTDSLSPRDSIATPSRIHQDQSNEGLRIVDDGRRIIYHEQNDAEDIAHGVTEFHRSEEEPIQLVKDGPLERKATRQSLDTRMPNLTTNLDSVLVETTQPNSVAPQKDEKPKEPVNTESPQDSKLEEHIFEPVEEPTAPIHAPEEHEPTVINLIDIPPRKSSLLRPTSKFTEVFHKEHDNVERSGGSHEEQWEIVEATDASQPSPPATDEEKTPTEAFERAKDVSTEVQPQTMAGLIPEPESQVLEAVKAPLEEASTIPVQVEVPSQSKETEERKVDTILDNFPEPPYDHRAHREVKAEELKEEESAVEAPTREAPPVPRIGDSAVDFEEKHEHEIPAETQEALHSDAVRSSSDSGISMEDQPREEEHEVELKREENKVASPNVDELQAEELKEEPKGKEFDESETFDSELLQLEDSCSAAEDLSKPASFDDPEHQPEYPHTPILSLSSSPMLEPVMEEDVIDDDDVPKPFPLSYDSSTLPPTMAKLLTPEERSHMLSSLRDDLPEPPRFERANLPAILTRPRTGTLPERRYSMAVALEIDTDRPGPDWASQEVSPIDAPPKSAFLLGRNSPPGQRRHPSAGYIGLREQGMHGIGLRNAVVPFRWRAMQQDWGSRPATSYSEQ